MDVERTEESPKSAAEQLAVETQLLPGVGPQRAMLLERLGLRTAGDLLFFFPRDYQDLSELKRVDQFVEGANASICGVVEEVDLRNTGAGRTVLAILVRQDMNHFRAIWFDQAFLRDKFSIGQRVLLSGRTKNQGLRWQMFHPQFQLLSSDEEPTSGQIAPVYSLTEGIPQGLMRRIMRQVVDRYAAVLDEAFPPALLEKFGLCPIQTAIRQIHRPSSPDDLEKARFRLVFQELLILQLALAWRRNRVTRASRAPSLPATAKIDARIMRLFPFELTDDQRQAIREIADDMQREVPMNRLLHGDVGAGKTAVAQYAMLLAVAHQHQAVLMAPTEILARQHARNLQKSLNQSQVRIGLLTGSLSTSQRNELLKDIAEHRIDLLVGTHAVLQPEVRFPKLGLVVIDEQHRFGVRQRAALRQAGIDPHYLVMTATPIPRTVTMTLFGDLDVSTIKQLPPGRPPVHTYLVPQTQRVRWWEFFRKKLREGRQGYVITPLVDEGQSESIASVEKSYEQLVNEELADFRVDIVHGRQKAAERDAAMEKFREGQTQVLVATSVVEVGVDVPNATMMTIENGERFGLAQLHQLRGRISRGLHAGYLGLFASPTSDESQKRLDSFCAVSDGFELAEIDFQLRGPGDLFSGQQHGMPPLRIADLQCDGQIVPQARAAAQAILQDDPELEDSALSRLRRMVLARYGRFLELSDVG